MGCLKLSYYKQTELKIISSKKVLTKEKTTLKERSSYLFGFNGQEKDNEIKGVGNSLDFGARIYDSRLGRFLSVDPLTSKFASISAYIFAGNSPIAFIDKEGLFQLSAETRKNYPALAIMIDKYLPLLIENKEVMNAFLENMESKMSPAQFKEMVSQKSGPSVIPCIGDSHFNPRDPKEINNLYINSEMLDRLESELKGAKSAGDVTPKLIGAMFNVSLSILHEASHRSAKLYGVADIDKSLGMAQIERGFDFEALLYGRGNTTSYSRAGGYDYADHIKRNSIAIKNYGTPSNWGMTASGYLNGSPDRYKLGIKSNVTKAGFFKTSQNKKKPY
jgi:RHS repeat-associated protein